MLYGKMDGSRPVGFAGGRLASLARQSRLVLPYRDLQQ